MKLVFVDRDGVVNQLVVRDGGEFSPRRSTDFTLLPGASKALTQLISSGYCVVIVTNQPDLSRGYLSLSSLAEMHSQLPEGLGGILICPHDAHDNCTCRKPKPGLLQKFISEVHEVITECWMIGDRESDLLAGRAVNATTIWITTGQQLRLQNPELADFSVESLPSAVQMILKVPI